MTNRAKFRFTVLCEDKAHFNFVSGYLQARGISSRRIYPNTPLPGVTSAEQYVRDKFDEEVKAHRNWVRENIVLIVVTDADKLTYNKRLRTLTDALQEQNSSPLKEKERIIILIPARNIETWFRYAVNPGECNEEEDYKLQSKQVPSSVGKEYAKRICPKLPADALPTLQEAQKEVERLQQLLF